MLWEISSSSRSSIDEDYNELVRHASDAQYQEMAAAILGIAFAVVGITSMIFSCINEKRIILRSSIGRSSRGNNEDSMGSVIRKYFFVMLGVACVTRAICLIVEAVVFDNEDFNQTDDINDSNYYVLVYTICLVLPDFFFVSAYSILCLYFAQSYYMMFSTPFESVEIILISSNIIVLLVFSILLALCANERQYYSWLYFIIAVSFTLEAIFTGYYANRLLEKVSPISAQGKKIKAKLYPLNIVASVATTTLCVCYYLLMWDYTHLGSDDDMYFGYLYFLCLLLELTPSVSYLFILYKKVGPEQEPISSGSREAISPSISTDGLATGVNNFRKSGDSLGGSNFNSYGGISSENLGVNSLPSRFLPSHDETNFLSSFIQNQQRRTSTSDMNSNSGGAFRRVSLNNVNELEMKPLINGGVVTGGGVVPTLKVTTDGNVMDVESK